MEIPQRHLRRRKRVPAAEILDEEQQENLINKYTEQAAAQARFYRLAFALTLAVPSPAFVLTKHGRTHPKIALICLISLLTSAFSLKLKSKQMPLVRTLNVVLAALIALRVYFLRNHNWQKPDYLFLFPLIAALSAMIIERWIAQVQVELLKLSNSRYELRGV